MKPNTCEENEIANKTTILANRKVLLLITCGSCLKETLCGVLEVNANPR